MAVEDLERTSLMGAASSQGKGPEVGSWSKGDGGKTTISRFRILF